MESWQTRSGVMFSNTSVSDKHKNKEKTPRSAFKEAVKGMISNAICPCRCVEMTDKAKRT